MKLFFASAGLLARCRNVCFFSFALFALFGAHVAHADTAEEIKAKIEIQNQKIKQLESEIAKYEADLVDIGKNKSTLQSEVQRLDTSRKKISADIAVTQNKITSANLQLEELGEQIVDKESKINTGTKAIAESMRRIRAIDDTTLVEHIFSTEGIERAWQDLDMIASLQLRLDQQIVVLDQARDQLSEHKEKVSKQKSELSSLKTELTGQKIILDQNRKEQSTLLTQTKNIESEYQKILADKRAARLQFEQELNQYESQLAYTLDPSKIPSTGAGVLQFPFDASFMLRCKEREKAFGNIYCITQYFGDTAFARSGAYNGKGHNGIDFGSPEGTQIKAAMSGVVTATGNTDAFRGCYSYGKWVLIQHSNGLSTLYAHLSYIGVGQGDAVPAGAMIGYSGKTGYATGPHLHFTVYATDGIKLVRLGDLKSKTNCANATVPVAPTSAYLNPLSYL